MVGSGTALASCALALMVDASSSSSSSSSSSTAGAATTRRVVPPPPHWDVFAGGYDSFDGSDAGRVACHSGASLTACAVACQRHCEGLRAGSCTGFDLNFCRPSPTKPGTCYLRSEPPASLAAARSVQPCYGAQNKTLYVWTNAPPPPTPPPPAAPTTVEVSVDLRQTASPAPSSFTHFWKRSFGSGHGALTLRSDWRQAAAAAVQELGMRAVRFHGLFDDDMGPPVLRAADGSLQYNFTSIDSSVDFQISRGMLPVLEMGFMPAALANCTLIDRDLDNHTFNPGHTLCPGNGDGYQGVLRQPVDWNEWYSFIRAVVQHWTVRYGAASVSQWRFEVWNELMGYQWGPPGPSDSYMTLFNHTASAIKSVSASYRVGGPATMQLLHIDDFVHICENYSIPWDFVSSHLYPSDPMCPQGDTWDPGCFAAQVANARSRVPASKEFLLTEMSVDVGYPQDPPQHDTSAAAAAIFRFVGELADRNITAMSWWTFSDLFQEHGSSEPGAPVGIHGIPSVEFSDVYGLKTVHGIPKPGHRAFQALRDAGDLIVNALTVTEDGASLNASSAFAVFATLESGGTSASLKVYLSLWSNPTATAKAPNLLTRNRTVTVSLRMDDNDERYATAKATLTRIDATHCTPRERWESMGAPAVPTAAQLAELNASSQVVREPAPRREDGSVVLHLSGSSAVLLEFEAHH